MSNRDEPRQGWRGQRPPISTISTEELIQELESGYRDQSPIGDDDTLDEVIYRLRATDEQLRAELHAALLKEVLHGKGVL